MQELPCDNKRSDESVAAESEIVRYLREQRHDFMNNIQVIWGYLQLNKPRQAEEYIKNMNRRMNVLSQVLKAGPPNLSLFFYTMVDKFYKMGMDVDFDCTSDGIDVYYICGSQEIIDAVCNIFSGTTQNTMEDGTNEVFIDVFVEKSILYITITDNPYDNYNGFGYIEYSKDFNPTGCLLDILKQNNIMLAYKKEGGYISVQIGLKSLEA